MPEVASRAHLEAMVPTIERALKEPASRAGDLDGIAVTAGPGLAGALLVGVSAAKAYAYALGKPLYGVNHLASHICVDQLEHGPLPEPTMALLVSGGHSSLLLVPDITSDVGRWARPSTTRRARPSTRSPGCSDLGFPGGPVIDRLRARGRPVGDRLPARADRPARPGLRLLLLRPEDGRGPLDRGQAPPRARRCRCGTWRPPSRRRSWTC